MKIHNFIKDTKGMAQIELNAIKKQESLKVNVNEQVEGTKSGESPEEKPEQKKCKKKTEAKA
ncbi:MAG: hypothetical protein SPH22_09205 [Prevotella sp.]|nr:hypothetical protein [Prevotella sp.]MDY5289794.1 hypothetical protein [Prevotella sp.]